MVSAANENNTKPSIQSEQQSTVPSSNSEKDFEVTKKENNTLKKQSRIILKKLSQSENILIEDREYARELRGKFDTLKKENKELKNTREKNVSERDKALETSKLLYVKNQTLSENNKVLKEALSKVTEQSKGLDFLQGALSKKLKENRSITETFNKMMVKKQTELDTAKKQCTKLIAIEGTLKEKLTKQNVTIKTLQAEKESLQSKWDSESFEEEIRNLREDLEDKNLETKKLKNSLNEEITRFNECVAEEEFKSKCMQEKLKDQLSLGEEENETLKHQVLAYEEQIRTLKKEEKASVQEREQEDYRSIEEENRTYKQQLSDYEDQNETLKKEMKDIFEKRDQADVHVLQEENRYLSDRLVALEDQIEKLENDAKVYGQRNLETADETEKFNQKLSDVNANVFDLQKQNEDCRDRIIEKKLILQRNQVDYKSRLERDELLGKVIQDLEESLLQVVERGKVLEKDLTLLQVQSRSATKEKEVLTLALRAQNMDLHRQLDCELLDKKDLMNQVSQGRHYQKEINENLLEKDSLIESLSKDFEELRKSHINFEQLSVEKQNENRSLQEEKKEIIKKLEKAKEIASKFEEDVDELKNKKKALKKNLELAETRLLDEEGNNERFSQKIQENKQHLAQNVEMISELMSKKKDVEEHNKKLQKDSRELGKRYLKLQENLKKAEEEKGRVVEQLIQAVNAEEKTRSEAERILQFLNETNEKNTDFERQLNESSKKVDSLEIYIGKVEKEIQALHEQKQILEDYVQTMDYRTKDLELRLDEKIGECEARKEKNKLLESQEKLLEEEKERLLKTSEKLNEKIAEKEIERVSLLSQIDSLNATVIDDKNEAEKNKGLIEKLKDDLKTEEDFRQKIQMKNEEFSIEIVELEECIDLQRELISDVRREKEEVKSSCKSLESKVKKFQKDNDKNSKAIQSFESIIEDLEGKIQEYISTEKSLREENQRFESDLYDCEKQLEETSDCLNSVSTSMESQVQANDSLRGLIEKLEKEKIDLNISKQKIFQEGEIQKLEEELKDKDLQYEKLEERNKVFEVKEKLIIQQRNELEGALDKIKTKLEENEIERKSLLTLVDSKKETMTDEQIQMSNSKEAFEKLKNALQIQKRSRIQLQKQNEEMSKKIIEVDEWRKLQKEVIIDGKRDHKQLKFAYKDLESEAEKLKNENEKKTETVQNLELKLDGYVITERSLTESLQKTEVELSDCEKQLNATSEILKSMSASMESQVQANESLRALFEGLQVDNEVEGLVKQKQLLEGKIQKLEKELIDKNSHDSTSEDENEIQESREKSLIEENKNLMKALNKVNSEIEEKEADVKLLSAKIDSIRATMTDEQVETENSKEIVDKLSKALIHQKRSRILLQKQNEEMSKKVVEVDEWRELQREVIKDERREINQLTFTCKGLEEEVKDKQIENDKKSKSVQSLEAEIQGRMIAEKELRGKIQNIEVYIQKCERELKESTVSLTSLSSSMDSQVQANESLRGLVEKLQEEKGQLQSLLESQSLIYKASIEKEKASK
ncbi:MAG: epidermal growth factor receptor substrate 15 [Chlamydiales bacterium]|jgi:epidermal growth factor receptor substrate 15